MKMHIETNDDVLHEWMCGVGHSSAMLSDRADFDGNVTAAFLGAVAKTLANDICLFQEGGWPGCDAKGAKTASGSLHVEWTGVFKDSNGMDVGKIVVGD